MKKELDAVRNKIKEDPDLYLSYQSNIAMAFFDEYKKCSKKYKNRTDLHEISNRAAINFLNLWLKETS